MSPPNHSTRLMLLTFAFVVSGIFLPTSYAQCQAAATAPPKPPEIHAILEKVVHPNRFKLGGAVTARMTEPTKLRDGTEIPKGTHILGKVTEIRAKADKEGPSKLGLRLLFDRALPSSPGSLQCDPEPFVHCSEPSARSLGVESEQLLTQSEVFEDEILARTEGTHNPSEHMPEPQNHDKNLGETSQLT